MSSTPRVLIIDSQHAWRGLVPCRPTDVRNACWVGGRQNFTDSLGRRQHARDKQKKKAKKKNKNEKWLERTQIEMLTTI